MKFWSPISSDPVKPHTNIIHFWTPFKKKEVNKVYLRRAATLLEWVISFCQSKNMKLRKDQYEEGKAKFTNNFGILPWWIYDKQYDPGIESLAYLAVAALGSEMGWVPGLMIMVVLCRMVSKVGLFRHRCLDTDKIKPSSIIFSSIITAS